MTVEQITKILDNHSINYIISNGNIVADDIFIKKEKTYIEKVNLTNYTKPQLYMWLGY